MKRSLLFLSALSLALLMGACSSKAEANKPSEVQPSATVSAPVTSQVQAKLPEMAPQAEASNYVRMDMDSGNSIVIELAPDAAPLTVENFKKLVSEKFYDGVGFHRAVPGFVIQGGDPSGNGTGGSKETIKGEFLNNGVFNPLKHRRGVISMARSQDMDSASSQFFIVLDGRAASALNDRYAAFGQVIYGMDEVDRIAALPVGSQEDILDQPKMTKVYFISEADAKTLEGATDTTATTSAASAAPTESK